MNGICGRVVFGVVVAGSLLACKSDKCRPASATATASIDKALQTIGTERDLAAAAASEVDPAAIEGSQKTLEEQLALAAQTLDCKTLPRASNQDLVLVQQAFGDVATSLDKAPPPLGDAARPVLALIETMHGQLSAPNPGIAAWCTSMRDAVDKLRQAAPPLWVTALADAKRERARLDGELAMIEQVKTTVSGWRADIAAQRPIASAPDVGHGAARAHEDVEAYQAACH